VQSELEIMNKLLKNRIVSYCEPFPYRESILFEHWSVQKSVLFRVFMLLQSLLLWSLLLRAPTALRFLYAQLGTKRLQSVEFCVSLCCSSSKSTSDGGGFAVSSVGVAFANAMFTFGPKTLKTKDFLVKLCQLK